MKDCKSHEGYRHFLEWYGTKGGELFWDLLVEEVTNYSHDHGGGVVLEFHIERDRVNGLEGYYRNEITGTIESDLYCYEFSVIDEHCSDTVLEYFELTLDKKKKKRKIDDLPRAKVARKSEVTDIMPKSFDTKDLEISWGDIDLSLGWAEDTTLKITGKIRHKPRNIEISGTFVFDGDVKELFTKSSDNAGTVNPKENNKMVVSTKNVATVILMDMDSNVPADKSIVAQFKDVVYTGDQQQLINNLLIEEDIKGYILMHNERVRAKLLNLNTLDRHGIEVKLRPIEFKDLEIQIK